MKTLKIIGLILLILIALSVIFLGITAAASLINGNLFTEQLKHWLYAIGDFFKKPFVKQ